MMTASDGYICSFWRISARKTVFFITKDEIFIAKNAERTKKTKNIYRKTVIGVLLKEIWINYLIIRNRTTIVAF